MQNLEQLLAQQKALEAQIRQAQQEQKADAIAKCKNIIAQFALTEQDLFSSRGRRANAGTKVAPKYRNPQTGETWTGRGKAPKWIASGNREQFLIA